MLIDMKKRVMLGMSGGVDSSVAAAVLLEQGYDVTGVTLKLRPDEYMDESLSGGCCSLDDIDDARRVAYKLGIDHLVFNYTDLFKTNVINYFVREYENGRTPNPCIACNQYIKFDSLLTKALALGYDYIATGHYAIIEYDNSINRFLLKKSHCAKDQSYVLYNMNQHQLAHTLLPIANMEKPKVRELAEKYNLPIAHKPDSQEICFVKDNNYARFIEEYTNKKLPKGNFINKEGKVLGEHLGITKYTVGQRKGLGVTFGKPMYVTNINPQDNTITLGEEGSQYQSQLIADHLNFIPFDLLDKTINATAKVRYQANPCNVTITPDGSKVKVNFEEPQRAVTPGQSIVFYDGDIVLGGGIIVK